MEGWRSASKGLGPLPRRRGSALAHGCGRGGRVVLPLARAAAVSTGQRVLRVKQVLAWTALGVMLSNGHGQLVRAWLGLGVGLG